MHLTTTSDLVAICRLFASLLDISKQIKDKLAIFREILLLIQNKSLTQNLIQNEIQFFCIRVCYSFQYFHLIFVFIMRYFF